jgi:hypothetical protein
VRAKLARRGCVIQRRRVRFAPVSGAARTEEGDDEDHVWFKDRWMVASWCDE